MSEGSYYLLLLMSFLVILISQILVKSRFNKYSQEVNSAGMTGKDIAKRILESNGIHNVSVEATAGSLTDNYNPTNKTVNLSEGVYNSATIAAIAIAAHECGHAIQHNVGYSFLKLRTTLIPILNISNTLGYAIIVISFLLGYLKLFEIGIVLASVAVLFHLVTLPVEFNASRRGLENLRGFNSFNENELYGCKKMLTAAALTYVGAALSSLVSLLRLILIFSGSRRRR